MSHLGSHCTIDCVTVQMADEPEDHDVAIKGVAVVSDWVMGYSGMGRWWGSMAESTYNLHALFVLGLLRNRIGVHQENMKLLKCA